MLLFAAGLASGGAGVVAAVGLTGGAELGELAGGAELEELAGGGGAVAGTTMVRCDVALEEIAAVVKGLGVDRALEGWCKQI